jgi:hypothetical protein
MDGGIALPGPDPGKATAVAEGRRLQLANDALAISWQVDGNVIRPVVLIDRISGNRMSLEGELFEITLTDGRAIKATDLAVTGSPRVMHVAANRKSSRLADRFGGRQLAVDLAHAESGLKVEWRAELRDGANYVREVLTLRAQHSVIPMDRLVLIDLAVPEAQEIGTVDGSPVISGNFFFGYEHPMARNLAGYPAREVGTWGPSQVTFPQHAQIRWDVTDALEDDGPHEVLFQYTGGDHRLEIFRVVLLEDGEEVASDEHFGVTGNEDTSNRYKLDLPSYNTSAKYTLLADVRSDGGTDSHGVVSISHTRGVPRIHASLKRNTPLEAGESLTQSSVIGVVPAGQLRRGFLHYVERERAHPYRPFLHYNSWYDIGYFSKFSEADCLRVITAYGQELVEKRGVTLDSFLFDDGWDDHASLWDFHDGLPEGFAPVKQATAAYRAAPGVWLSPWGGYGDPKKQRLKSGRAAGYEVNERGFVLSAPRYYRRFREICLEMIHRYGVNQFKFDGIGRASGRYPGSEFGSDFEAAIQLMRDLRETRPDIYINLTTGTWPSPFWLAHADSIWRGGYDHEFAGVGSDRQRWMTYRDATTYQNVVKRAPLFPLSSLMLHGIIYAKHARQLDTDPGDDLRDEIRTAFGSGTQLQEMYISPDLLTPNNWDDLAESAGWAREKARTLQDTHWIGGDPAKLEVYGWASWSPAKGILVLRNPSAEVQTYGIDIGQALELPATSPRAYRLTSPYDDQRIDTLRLKAGEARTLELQPFEVLVFDAAAGRSEFP